MAYLLVLLVDNSPHEAGDIISWRDENMNTLDGAHGFGTKTLQDERFKIVHVPDLSDAEANELCRTQGDYHRHTLRDGTVIEKNPDAKYRAYKFNIDLLKSTDKQKVIAPNKSESQRFTKNLDGTVTMLDVINLEIPKSEFLVAKELKPVIDNREGAFVREIT